MSYMESTMVKNVYTSQQEASGAGYGAGYGTGYGSGVGVYDAASGGSPGMAGGYEMSSAGAYSSSGMDTMASGFGYGSGGGGQIVSGDAAMMTSSSFSYEQRSAGLLQANGYVPGTPGSPTASESMFGAGMYSMRNLQLSSGAANPNLMTTAEQIRVDCVQLTNNGRFVITGSIYGPPQVWDLKVSPYCLL